MPFPLFISESTRQDYVKNLKAFATLKESMDLSDKVILAATTRLLDPYNNTSEETRDRLLNKYPVHSYGLLKRIMLFSMTNIGYDEAIDREKMTNLRYLRYKPLEPHFHENNQAQSILNDAELYKNLIATEQTDGFEAMYAEGHVSSNYVDLFKESQEAFDEEADTYIVASNYLKTSTHILQQLVTQGYSVYCPTVYLQSALHSQLLTLAEVHEFISKQIIVIQSEIDKSLVRQIKKERERTEMLRGFLKAYAIFKSDFLPESAI